MPTLVENRIATYLSRNMIEGAMWTGDIADGICEPTSTVRAALKRMATRGEVVQMVKGGKGLPSSWKLSPEKETQP